jgi:hypothetical protein
MRTLHWVALGAFFTALSALVSTLPTWVEATHPPFIGAVIGMIGSFVVALVAGAPTEGSATAAVAQSLHLMPKDGQ